MNWSNIEIDQVRPISMFDESKEEELREASNWKNIQTLSREVHQYKGSKIGSLAYRLHFIKSYQFLELHED